MFKLYGQWNDAQGSHGRTARWVGAGCLPPWSPASKGMYNQGSQVTQTDIKSDATFHFWVFRSIRHLRSNMLEKATQGTSKKPELRTTVDLSAAFTVWHVLSISDVNNGSNGSGMKASQRGPEQAQVYQQRYLRKVLPLKAGACMKEVTVWMEELKNLFLDEIKSRERSFKKQREKFRCMRACGHHIKTSIWCDGGPYKAVQKSSKRCCSLQERNTTQVSPAFQEAVLLSWKHAQLKKKKTRHFELERYIYLKNALTFTQQSNN